MQISEINRPRAWNGGKLAGDWLITLKLDGVRAIWIDERGWRSRADKPLYNIPAWQHGRPLDCEVFVGSFRDTIRATRTKCITGETPPIQAANMYGLEPHD